jgi:malate dehydrogenase
MVRTKITVIGAGNVGAATTQRLAEKDFCDVVLVDIVEGMPQGKALDIMQSGPVCGYDSKVVGTNNYEETSGSKIIIITSGLPRKPGMSRDDLLKVNAGIVQEVTRKALSKSPGAILIVVSNPLDAMTYVASKVAAREFGYGAADIQAKVMGMAGVLDSARFRTFIAMELGVPVSEVQAMTLGGHGDSMVPLVRQATVKGRPVSEWLTPDRVGAIVDRTAKGGAEIVSLLKTGSAYYAPSASTVLMVESILFDKKHVLPCAVLSTGKYPGCDGLFVGLPAKLGAAGVEEVVHFELDESESTMLRKSAADVKELCDAVDRLGF